MSRNIKPINSTAPRSPVETIGLLEARYENEMNNIAGLADLRIAEADQNANPQKKIKTLEQQVGALNNVADLGLKLRAAERQAAKDKRQVAADDASKLRAAIRRVETTLASTVMATTFAARLHVPLAAFITAVIFAPDSTSNSSTLVGRLVLILIMQLVTGWVVAYFTQKHSN
ncbi:hypothetical protein NA57DRAFT_55052 [Rhizodiscina lignyota]|uniref:Uncharacterized protein n=1 Tax=Rhizodiscina lignyota TaxID=1504668 RepID=A0A9P4IM57_9PEZI|nr:hypothetical protein NA57DRAFT_55052 [Rhizodiscina lignyota]